MKFYAIFFTIIYLLLINNTSILAQKPDYASAFQRAKQQFQAGDYRAALQGFDTLSAGKGIAANALYDYRARCHARLGQPLQAKADYVQVSKLSTEQYRALGLVCHAAQQFDSAAYYYKRYIERLPETAPRREATKLLLRQCEWAPRWYELSGHSARAVVQPMGKEVNSQQNEYGAYFHPQYYYNLFFSSDRRFLQTNVFQTIFSVGSWTTGDTTLSFFNSFKEDEMMAGFYGNASSTLVFQRNDSLFIENKQSQNKDDRFVPFAVDLLDAKGKDLDFQWFSDSLVLFSSDRVGGYGGLDLYYSILTDTGWAQPRNMGAVVNGRYDERAPFLELDGRSLRFSAQNPRGIGGFDFYETTFSDSSLQWQEPELLLPPFSSCGDDLHWTSHPEGWQVFFASDRAGGEGGFDLYAAYLLRPQFYETNQPIFSDFWEGRATADTSTWQIVQKPVEIKQFHLTTVFYPRSTGVWLGDKALVNALDTLLRNFPQTRLVLDAHTDNSGARDYDAFLSLQQADKLALRLIERGASPDQILVRGCGQGHPIALNNTANGSVNTSGRNMNQRIEPLVLLAEKSPVEVHYNYPVVSEIMDTSAGEQYRRQQEGLTYKVLVMQTANFNSHPAFNLSPYISAERHPQQSKTNFYVGFTADFAEAYALWQQVQAQGIQDSRIVAYWKGFPMNLAEARWWSTQFSDLKQYVELAEKEQW